MSVSQGILGSWCRFPIVGSTGALLLTATNFPDADFGGIMRIANHQISPFSVLTAAKLLKVLVHPPHSDGRLRVKFTTDLLALRRCSWTTFRNKKPEY